MKAEGSCIFLADGMGGFDLRGCPNSKELADLIELRCNAFVKIIAALESCKIWHQGDKFRFSNNREQQEAWALHRDLIEDALQEAGAA